MGDLPHVNAGYIQVEETQFQQSVDSGIYTKMGSDLNFIKDQADTAIADAAVLFGSTYQASQAAPSGSTDANGNFSGLMLDLGGKSIKFAAIALRMGPNQYGTFAPAVALVGTPNKKTLYNMFGANFNQYGFTSGAVPPYIQVQLQNAPVYDQIYINLFAGQNPSGPFGSTIPYLPANAGFTCYITAIYPTPP